MKNENLKKSILDKIEKNDIKPVSKNYFNWKNRIFWWILIFILFLAMVFWTFFLDDSLDYWKYWRNSWFSIFFFVPHFIWTFLVFLLVFLWIKEYKNTKSGYKKSTLSIIIFLLVIIFFWIFFFRWFWFWQFFRHSILEKTSINNYIYDLSLWNAPENWRIAWVIESFSSKEIILKDTSWKEWKIDISNSFISPIVEIKNGAKIRIFWNIVKNNIFKAQKIAPEQGRWMWGWIWNWGNI